MAAISYIVRHVHVEALFPRLPNVRQLTFDGHRMNIQSLVAGLQAMPQLTSLSLETKLTNEHLCTILPGMKVLQFLQLTDSSSLVSLAFLTHASSSLTQLKLGQSIPHADIDFLEALPQLEVLMLQDLFHRGIHRQLVDRMDPSSPLYEKAKWPTMRVFFLGSAIAQAVVDFRGRAQEMGWISSTKAPSRERQRGRTGAAEHRTAWSGNGTAATETASDD